MSLIVPAKTKRVYLSKRPIEGIEKDTFVSETTYVKQPGPDEVVVRVDIVSLDPAMRGWIRDVRSYTPPVKIGETMRAGALGTVLTNGKTLKKGDIVQGYLGWTEYSTIKEKFLEKVVAPPGANPVDFLGPLGMIGMTAYFGILYVGKIKPGQTVVVSGAAGATGSLVCQIAKIKGAKVIGIAGAEDKCRWLVEDLGIDKAYNYNEQGWHSRFKREVGYLDVFFDNVGGSILDFMLTRLNLNARIVLCGTISEYNSSKPRGLQNYQTLTAMRASIQGFIVFDFTNDYPKAVADMAQWIQEGKLKRKYHIESGLENCPRYLQMLFRGENRGKL
ncbi:alcohol dehydrogenase [Cantharellus anzutake]|uniref:alcohol dehydrogenase n=1 Tax=Cantharellus anzutake TaxID=1750568 RepID=UPI00190620F5|nr:alcohol dehydrogenase [Cantharellus anzutake]XP_038921639.1 alcohol dehydrogenase [Cantharellus anzutake]KAF8320982.1 alcohol dehydrogenase [Cantharellus anzutake]KAF8340277.1 alcohol dehydrogenase [Cantharellus anzutake]